MQREAESFQGRKSELHRDLQLSSSAIVSLVLQASRNVPLLAVPKGTAPAMSVLLRLCAAPLGRGSGSRAGPAQGQRSAVVVGRHSVVMMECGEGILGGLFGSVVACPVGVVC